MTGSGNDFVFVDGRRTTAADWPPARIAAACDRRSGAGGDGLVILTPEAADRVRMEYFNADGSAAAMCGNAALCSTRLAAALGIAPAAGMDIGTPAGPMRTRCVGGEHDAEINLADTATPRPVEITRGGGEELMLLGTVGVPHLVVLVADVDAVDVAIRGHDLRRHSRLGPAGANANFVSPPDQGSRGRWRIRTYERGVEAETLACGTGTVAAALALIELGRAASPVDFVSWGRMPLGVRARVAAGRATEIWLRGEGRLVYEGSFTDL